MAGKSRSPSAGPVLTPRSTKATLAAGATPFQFLRSAEEERDDPTAAPATWEPCPSLESVVSAWAQ